jgi:tRNA dimethylallyltransferase
MVREDRHVRPVVAVVGPTAVGKSAVAIAIARRFDGEVINGDAFQFYRGLDIGTAKLAAADRCGIVHRLLDILDPNDRFSVADYQRLVRNEIAVVRSSGRMPILCGGSGLYLQAALYDYRFPGQGRDPEKAEDPRSTKELYEFLVATAPLAARDVDPANRRRILRLLDTVGDIPVDDFDRTSGANRFYPDAIVVGLSMPRGALCARIDARVETMIGEGLEKEARTLFDAGVTGQAAAAIGYRELFAYFRGETTLEEATALIRLHTRQYAKRQMTWFRNRMEPKWFEVDPERPEAVVSTVLEHLAALSGIA